MLDFAASLQKAISGRLDGASTLAEVNEALRDLFDRSRELAEPPKPREAPEPHPLRQVARAA